MRIAVFGLGGVAERIHLPACKQVADVQVVGACDVNEVRREDLARKFAIAKVYEDAERLLACEKPELVIIGTPPQSHHHLCLMALESGAHVLCEKPFMSSVEEADQVIQEADRRQLCVKINTQYRYMKIYRETHDRLDRGEFGRPYFLQCWQQMYHPPYMEENWRARLIQSTLFEFGTHALDLVCYMFDDLPVSVNATIPTVRPDIPSDILVQATLRFPGERLATLAFNRVSHAPERYLEMRLDCEQASLRLSLGGVARAALDWSRKLGRPMFRVSLVKGGEVRAEAGGRSRAIVRQRDSAFASATALHLREFLRSISRGSRSNDAARHAREVLRIVFAGYESARTGETVWLRSRAAG